MKPVPRNVEIVQKVCWLCAHALAELMISVKRTDRNPLFELMSVAYAEGTRGTHLCDLHQSAVDELRNELGRG